MKIIRPVFVAQDGGFTRDSVGTYWDKSGVLKTAVANTLRVTYDPTNLAAPPYAMYEKESVNLLKASEQFDLSEWPKSRASVQSNSALAPDGTVSADKIIPDSTLSAHYIEQQVNGTYTDGSVYTASFFAKAAELKYIRFDLYYAIGSTGGLSVVFDLVNGTCDKNSEIRSASIKSVGNGWFKCEVTAAVAYASLHGNRTLVRILPSSSAGNPNLIGFNSEGFYLWGIQFESGSKATSYFPTSPVFVSRGSVGTYFDSAGTLQTAPVNTARYSYNPANLVAEDDLLAEFASTNFIRNNTMQAGGAGAFPTNWSGSLGSNGITVTFVGVGIENGVEYFEISYTGTATSAVNFFVNTESFTQIVATSGQTWVGSMFLRTTSGSRPSVMQMSASGRLANGDSVEGAVDKVTPTNASLSSQRFTSTSSFVNANTARVGLYLHVGAASGEVVNMTLRIGLPQLERTVVSSPIKTTNAAVSRSADVVSYSQLRSADVIGTHGLQYSSIAENEYPAWNAATAYVKGDRVLDAPNHKIYESMAGTKATALTPVASPGRISLTVDGLPFVPAPGTPIKFTTTGTLPTGITAGTTYYVKDITGDTFTYSGSAVGTAINITGTQTGVHTVITQDNVGKPLNNKSFWIDAGASNKYKPFDTYVQSQATALSDITFSVSAATYVDTIALLNLKGSSVTVTVTHVDDGLVFSETSPLVSNDSNIENWYDYFLAGFNAKREALVEGIPRYRNIIITVSLKGVVGQEVSMGAAIFGLSKDISVSRTGAEHGAKVGIQAFDTKKRDEFGNYTIVPRAFAKRADFTIYISNNELDGIVDLLTDIRSVPTLYLGSNKYNTTMVYGYYKSFDIDISYPLYSVCSIQLEGLT